MKRYKNIKKKIARAALYSPTLVHVKHYRGRRVHSPFVYGIIRNAIMRREPDGEGDELFDRLREKGLSKRRAAQLQSLYSYRGYRSSPFAEDGAPLPPLDEGTLCFAMPSLAPDETARLMAEAAGTGCTVCFVSPRLDRRRKKTAARLVSEHRHTSIDNRGFLLLFFNERLPKQHFNL